MDRRMDEQKGKTHHNITFTVAFQQVRIASIAHDYGRIVVLFLDSLQ